MRLNPKQIANYTGGEFLVEPIDGSRLILGFSWDSREIEKDFLFVAFPGERVDGHDYIVPAMRRGATCVLLSTPPKQEVRSLASELGVALIMVPDTHRALSDLARAWRGFLKGTVIGLTGSVGKTSTKNMIRDILATEYKVVATKANQNNELGVPRTILTADVETEYIVVEMGMRGTGQIQAACDIAKPHWGVITNTGNAHIEILKTREAIAEAKAELIAALPAGTGKAFLCADNAYTEHMIEHTQAAERGISLYLFDAPGSEESGDIAMAPVFRVGAEDIEMDGEGYASFTICVSGERKERMRARLSLRGIHNVANALTAISVALAAGMSLESICDALGHLQGESGRQELFHMETGAQVIHDAYNANPDSMRAALQMLASLDIEGKRIAVLGDMGELGEYAQSCHEGIGRLVAQLGIDRLIVMGELSAYIAQAAREEGMSNDAIYEATSIADLLSELEPLMTADDAVLIKASHFMEFDRLVKGLIS